MISVCIVETAYGWVGLASSEGRLVSSVLPRETREQALEAVSAESGDYVTENEAALGLLPEKLRNYFDGMRVEFSGVSVDLRQMSPFVSSALRVCQRVPYGSLATYAEIARRAGSERAHRAVGNAMSRNPMPIIVPCHRIVASGGGLGGYSGGLDWKRRLLELEGVTL